MLVLINERLVDYSPAPAKEWSVSSNDPFMFPVRLNNTDCFVKRFEHGDASRVTGLGLLHKLKGKNVGQLPFVFDVQEGQAEGHKALYVFMKFIEGGRTLDKISSLGNADFIRKLSEDIFSGLAAVHRRGYWIADFCEKNVLWDKDGHSYLLDLDSSIPLTDYPRIDMYGSKRYWTPVVNSYRLLMGGMDVVWMELDGSCLNYLQLALLILHFKLRLPAGSGERTVAALDHLSPYLHTHFPDSVPVFLEAFRQGSAFSEEQIAKVKRLVGQIIEKDPTSLPAAASSVYTVKPKPRQNTPPAASPANTASPTSPAGTSPSPTPPSPATPILDDLFVMTLAKVAKAAGLHLILGWIIYGLAGVSLLVTMVYWQESVRSGQGLLILLGM